MARPMALIVKIESSERPPRVSATRGMHSAPAARQAERLEASLRRVPTCKAWPGVKAASARVSCWRGEITCTSRAAGLPWHQFGSDMSAGLERELGTNPGVSFEGASAADWAAVKSTSLMALWQEILSPFPPHPTWWHPWCRQCHGILGREMRCCAGESLASTASSTGTHDPGDGAPRRMMAPHSANHRRAAGQMTEPGLESGWRGLTKGDAGMKPHRWSERVLVAAEECQCHPGTPTLAGQPQRQGQKQPGWYEGRCQVDDQSEYAISCSI